VAPDDKITALELGDAAALLEDNPVGTAHTALTAERAVAIHCESALAEADDVHCRADSDADEAAR